MKNFKHYGVVLLASLLLVGVAGCTRHISRDISPEGQVGELMFPALDTLVLKQGTFPNVDSLRQVAPGVTKDQLYYLLGRPHFREASGAREWDYLFHFRRNGEVTTCQYKVIFDKERHGQTFHWLPADCAGVLDKPQVVAEPPKFAPATATTERRFELSGGAMFAFGRSSIADILPAGRVELEAIAEQLRTSDLFSVTVIGHTDRIGKDQQNRLLSQQRADSVRGFLASLGVPAASITAVGMGEQQPVVACQGDDKRNDVIECLQANRRVEIVAKTTK
ncbi:OmpA family protein [Lysobacter sp. FW306-1B-D06B]|uniref:OmpA family protein n=1 Tax=Lysobacter sp. FW306-1B-D06B TaxID=3140250 RepID=UPI003140105F